MKKKWKEEIPNVIVHRASFTNMWQKNYRHIVVNMFILSSSPKPKQDIRIRKSPFRSAFETRTDGELKVLSDPNIYFDFIERLPFKLQNFKLKSIWE